MSTNSAKCPDCGQAVIVAAVESMGQLTNQRFTARSAVVYIVSGHVDDLDQLERFAPDVRLYLYHDAVCPRRQLVSQAGAAQCRSCPASIRWALTPLGARIPLDVAPVTVYTMDESTVAARMVEYPALEPLYLSHFASCPNAGQHSKARPRR